MSILLLMLRLKKDEYDVGERFCRDLMLFGPIEKAVRLYKSS